MSERGTCRFAARVPTLVKLALAGSLVIAPFATQAMGLGWGCSASQPPAVTVQTEAASALVGTTVTLSVTATSLGANVQSFVAAVPTGQGTLAGGTTLDDGSTQFSFATGSASVSGSASWVLPAEPGTYSVTVTATNCASGTGSATATVNVTPQPVVLPVIDSLASSTRSVLAGRPVTLIVSAHDPAGGSLQYAWSTSAGTIQASGASATLTAPEVAGSVTVTAGVSSTSGGPSVSGTFDIDVVLAQSQGSMGDPLVGPHRLALAPEGYLYVVDGRGGLHILTAKGEQMGSVELPDGALAVAAARGAAYVSTVHGKILQIDPAAARVVGSLDVGYALGPMGLAFDQANGLLWLAERDAGQLRAIRLDGTTVSVARFGGGQSLAGANDVAIDPGSGLVWVVLDSNPGGFLAHAFTLRDGSYAKSALPGGTSPSGVTRAGGIAVDATGRVFVSDAYAGQVQVVSGAGQYLGALGRFGNGPGELRQPSGVMVLPNGDILVANSDAGRIERYGISPTAPVAYCPGDSDCDGMPDWWELKYGFNPNWAGDALLDSDGDGLTNLQEYKLGTNPRNRDTDGDGVSDGDEVAMGFDPLDPSDQKPALTVPAPKTSDPGMVRFSTSLKWPSACSVAWKQRLGPAVPLRGADSLTPSFVGRTAGRYQFQGAAVCGSVTSPTAVLEATIRNVPPRADAGRLLVAHAGDRAVLDARFSSDPNGDALAFAWDQSAGAALAGAATGPTLALRLRQPGYFAFQLTATDPAARSGTAEASVLVVDGGDNTLTAVAASPIAGPVGAPVTLDAIASSDPLGTATYAWTQVAGASVTISGAGNATASFTPAQAGHYAFEVTLSTGRFRSPPARVEVYVGPGGALPKAAVTQPAPAATVGEPVALEGGASAGATGSGLAYSWRQVSGPAAGLTDADRAVATMVPFAPGAYVFELAVIENGAPGLPVRVSVLANSAQAGRGVPVAVAIGPAAGMAGTSLSLDGTGSSDPDGHWLRYRWTQVAGPWVALDDPTSATPSFRPYQPGTYEFELEVDDGTVRSAPARVKVQGNKP